MIKVIASDMDGTFLNDQGTFDAKQFQDQLNRMKNKGMHFVVASSDPYSHLLKLFKDVDGPISYICNNGAAVFDERGVIVSETTIDPLMVQKAVSFVLSSPKFAGVQIVISSRDGDYTNLKADSKKFKASQYFYENLQSVPDIKLVFNQVYKIDLYWNDDKDVSEQQAELQNKFNRDLNIFSSGLGGVDINASGLNKMTALNQLLDQWDLTAENAAAFGDNGNDFDLINGVKEGYAVQNAAKDLSNIVDNQLDLSNNQAAVQEKIEEYLK